LASPLAIRFLPDDRIFTGPGPVELYLAASACDVLLDEPCGSAGRCGKCRVRFLEDPPDPTPADLALLTRSELDSGWRLGCQAVLRRSSTVEVRPASRSVAQKSFGGPLEPDPARRGIRDGQGGWGLAIDIGTTTLGVGLVRLDDGRVEQCVSRLNPQAAFGADVMSRIYAASTQPDGRNRLRDAVRSELASMIRDVLARGRVVPERVGLAALVGNPTMMHLWAGIDVSPLGQAPFVSPWTDEFTCEAREADLPIRGDALVYVFPSIRSHVGADAVAAAVATGIDMGDRPRLVMDIGTNSEVVAGSCDGLVAASTSAGPAFEGATITCGMRATRGAVDTLSISPDGGIAFDTIDHAPAVGLCGSGLIDAASELVRAGVLTASGYLKSGAELRDGALGRRITEFGRSRAVVLADDTEKGGGPVELTALDVRQLQLAKSSIRAGISVICRELDVRESDLDSVFVAGVFGTHVRKASLLRIGLIPGIDPERVMFVGNAAGVGARLALLDRRVRDRARDVARRVRFIDLASDPGYREAFLSSLSFSE
jgi:uncharacterized 2Fe-2S/4Fe-4S cluster protein (DUF4445 family)